MSTPLYKKMKNGSSFYTFPSSSMHPNPNFTKFVLLNIPNSIDENGDVLGRLDFQEANFQAGTYNIWSEGSGNSTLTYSDRLVESLRNYIANHDETMRNSKISNTKDFYNIKEKQTPTEIIFWKWLKKIRAIEFEVARHKVDWDKNLPDFDNNNADTITNTDFFRKYLWKEREVIDYSVETVTGIGTQTYSGILYENIVEIVISYKAIFKIGDKILFNIPVGAIKTGKEYIILEKTYNDVTKQTHLYINVPDFIENDDYNENNLTVKLSYHRIVEYIGEINLKSDVRTARRDETEVMVYLPHQAGRTPTVLFETRFDSNYYPGLSLPILSEQIQTEILGAENLESPIRKNPGDYPGSYYGQFDTMDKTYESSTGDKFRYSGEYFGITRNNNIGLSDEKYIESLEEFDSVYLDGINIDFNLNHYQKMSITDKQVGFNFDEFNQLIIDNVPPQSFEYNAILWYYEVDGDDINDTKIYTNLYGITFLNNPENSTTYVYNSETEKNELDNTIIDTYKKLVSNDDYDGLSYIHTLNIMTSVDNDISTMSFDPLTINNSMGFEIYQNVMTNVAKLNESFLNMINSFLTMNTELNNVKSLVYTQTDIDTIKSKMKNMEDLLNLYSKYQFIDSETVSIITNYANTYPTLSFNVKNSEYSSVYNIKSSDIFNYYISNGAGYKIIVPDSNKLFVKILNDDITNYSDLSIVLDKDLKYKQSAEILIDTLEGFYNDRLSVYVNYYNNNTGYPQNTLFDTLDIYLPNDIGSYLSDSSKTYNKVHYNNNTISQTINLVESVGSIDTPFTLLYPTTQNCFGSNDYQEKVYIDNFYFKNTSNEIINKNGVYIIGKTDVDFNQAYFKINEDTFDLTLVSTPVVYLVKKIKVTITRINESDTSSLSDRYLIQKTYL